MGVENASRVCLQFHKWSNTVTFFHQQDALETSKCLSMFVCGRPVSCYFLTSPAVLLFK